MSDKKVEISQTQLDYLNRCRLILEPNNEIAENANVDIARNLTSQHIISMTVEERYLLLRRLEAMTSDIHNIIRQDADAAKAGITEKLGERWREAINTYKNNELEKERKRAFERLPTFVKKEKRNNEKAINALMALGMSREDAENSVLSTRSEYKKSLEDKETEEINNEVEA